MESNKSLFRANASQIRWLALVIYHCYCSKGISNVFIAGRRAINTVSSVSSG